MTRPMLGAKSFEAAPPTLTGMELVRMIRKGQMQGDEFGGITVADALGQMK